MTAKKKAKAKGLAKAPVEVRSKAPVLVAFVNGGVVEIRALSTERDRLREMGSDLPPIFLNQGDAFELGSDLIKASMKLLKEHDHDGNES
jgi:hypothetical protein